MKKLILVLTLFSSPAFARGFEAYDPSTGRTVYMQETCCEPAVYQKVRVPSDNYEPQMARFSNNLAPSLGNLGHRAYSDAVDVEME